MEKIQKFNEKYGKPHPNKEKLKELGIKQLAMANYLGIPEGTLSRYLGGYSRIPDDINKKMLKILSDLSE